MPITIGKEYQRTVNGENNSVQHNRCCKIRRICRKSVLHFEYAVFPNTFFAIFLSPWGAQDISFHRGYEKCSYAYTVL